MTDGKILVNIRKMPHEMWEIAHLYRVVVLKHLKG